jgi:hypothetical protein
MYKIILVICLLLIGSVSAQTYYLNGYVGLGYARFLTDMDLDGLNQNGYDGIIRLMWQPEHMLRVGLESGYHHLYTFEVNQVSTEFGVTDARSSLTAIPILFVAAAEVLPSIELLGGMGTTILHTYFDSYGYETNSSQLSTSYFIAGRYEYPLNESLAIGGELNYYRINKIEDAALSLRFMLSYRLLSW